MARFVPLITDDPVTLVKEVLLFAVDTIDDYNQSVPAAYVFKRDARIAVDVIEPVIRQYAGFDEELRKYIEDFDKEPTDPDGMSTKDILFQEYEQGMNGEKHIIKTIIKIIVQTRMDLDKFLDDVKPRKNKNKRFSSQQFKAFGTRLFQSSEILAQIEQQNREIQRLIDLLKTSNDLARRSEEPKLEQFRTKLLPEAFRFWERHIGQATWTDWDRFAQAYTALHGDSNTIDLKHIKEHLAVQEARNSDEPVTKMTLYGFITLTNTHGFPFVKNSQQLAIRRRELSPEARMEVAKMVINLMDQFTSMEMQKNFLEIEKLYDGIGKKDEARIKEKAAEWGKDRKQSRMQLEGEKSEKHRKADKVDVARRSVSFLYQRYMVIYRVGQLERDVLREVDFPGKGRIREFLAYYEPLDYVNYHHVRGLDPDRWLSAKPKVYKFLEELVRNLTKDQKDTAAKYGQQTKEKEDTAKDQEGTTGGSGQGHAIDETDTTDDHSEPQSPQPGP